MPRLSDMGSRPAAAARGLRRVFRGAPRVWMTLALLTCAVPARAQLYPAPQALPYHQAFGALDWTSTTCPAGWQGWRLLTYPGTSYDTVSPDGTRPLKASGDASATGAGIYNYNGKIGFVNLTGYQSSALGLAIDATSGAGLQVSYTVGVLRNPYNGAANTRIGECALQYRVGSTGAFITLPGTEYQSLPALQIAAGVTTPQNPQPRTVALPAECDHQPVVQLRWLARDVSGAGGRPSFAVDDIEVLRSFAITADAGPNGSVSPGGATQILEGQSQVVTITPDPGYHIADVVVDGGSVGAVTSHTFTAVAAHHTLHATFALDGFTLAAGAVGAGSVVRDPDLPVYAGGSSVTLTAVPAATWAFAGWSGDTTGTDNPLTVTISTHHQVVANFVDPVPPAVALTSPNGGEVWGTGSVHNVVWSASDNDSVASIALDYSADGGATWSPIASGLPSAGAYAWTLPAVVTTQARVRVTAVDPTSNAALDSSDADFELQDMSPSSGSGPILSLRAALADGAAPYPVPGAAGPWVDVAGNHDAALMDFLGNPSSGWRGNGTVASPYRLEFGGEDTYVENVVTIPAQSVPELQSIAPVTAALWFRTGYDGPQERYDYLLEWVEPPLAPNDPEVEGRGMSIAIQNGKLIVYQNPWVEGGDLAPATWYHVVVVKAAGDLRIYLNGVRTYTGTHPHMGTQQSEIVLGASTFRVFENLPPYADFFGGAIAQADLWARTLDDAEVLSLYQSGRPQYPLGPSLPAPTEVVALRAAQADGSNHYPIPGAGSPWKDLAPAATDAGLAGFDGTATSGWQGDGTPISPYRLEFDGIDDVAAIPAGAIAELQDADASSAELWFRTGPNVASGDYRYLIEWLQGLGATPGMSLAVASGTLQLYLDNPTWVTVDSVKSSTWYHVIVAKRPGQVKVYVNGAPRFTGAIPNFGDPTTEVVLGASTWRGNGAYGEFHDGAIAMASLWRGALGDSAAQARYLAGKQQFPYTLRVETVGNGSVTKNPDLPGYDHGATVQLTAVPDAGFVFAGWSGDASGNTNPLTVTMTDNKHIVAVFGSTTAAGDLEPRDFKLTAVGPNPMRGVLRVGYSVPFAAPVSVTVLDIQGREVARLAEGPHRPGRYEAYWNGTLGRRPASNGIYFVRVQGGGQDVARRVVLAR